MFTLANNKRSSTRKSRGFTPLGDRQRDSHGKKSLINTRLSQILVIAATVVVATVAWYFYTQRTIGAEVTTPSGLRYVDVNIGSGSTPTPGKSIKVHYTGTLEDGTKFDSSFDRNQPFEFIFGVGQVIKGWDEGLATMKLGGKRKLIIPPDLGYGSSGAGSIPSNSTLYFDVELVSVD